MICSTCASLPFSGEYKWYVETKEEDCEPLYYVLAGAYASHILTNFDLFSRSDELENNFALIEKFHNDGDDYVKEWATVGILEGMQNHIGKDRQAEMYPKCEKYLGPESRFWWDELERFWKNEIPYLGATRAASK